MDGLLGHDLTLPIGFRTLDVVLPLTAALAPAATLPDWLDADRLRWMTLAAMAVLVVVGLVVARFVQRILTMVVGLALVGGLLAAIWFERNDLQNCQETCSCRLFAQDVKVPDGPLCGEDRFQLSDES